MFRPVSLFIGLRYTGAKKRNHFVSFIALTSMLGIALGVTVLITVLSVMNGFDFQIRNRIFQMAPQVTVRTFNTSMENYQSLQTKLSKVPGVIGTAAFIEGQGMLTHDGLVNPVLINGIVPDQETQVSEIGSKMIQGNLSELKPGSFNIVMGEQLANALGLTLGDKVTLVTPEAALTPVGVIPRFKRFTLIGIFNAGTGFGFDTQFAVINLQDAQVLYQLGQGITGIQLKIKNLYDAPELSSIIAQHITNDYFVTNWTQKYGPLFKAINLEKNMMFLILLLIIAVAAFNLVSSLVMIVNDKRADIAILRTLGATPRMILVIFIVQGFLIGLIGTLVGLVGGLILASHVTEVVNFIQKILGVQFLASSVYYVNYLPSLIQASDVIHICLAAFILSLLATLYPAWRASKTQPAEALRYE